MPTLPEARDDAERRDQRPEATEQSAGELGQHVVLSLPETEGGWLELLRGFGLASEGVGEGLGAFNAMGEVLLIRPLAEDHQP